MSDQANWPEADLPRSGWALAAGGAMGGAVAVLLALGGGADAIAGVMAFALGTLATMAAITIGALPLWIILHYRGARRLRHAAILGAVIAFVLALSAQTHGFGLVAAPPVDAATQVYRWVSAAATSLMLAAVGAAIAVVMWAIAYRARD
ncbi:MAG: hypothetical protein C0476_03685 [Sphingomonas sp.]|nr:hypothetical protein [Sphingomonas sp.]